MDTDDTRQAPDELDAFFKAAEKQNPVDLRRAAANIARTPTQSQEDDNQRPQEPPPPAPEFQEVPQEESLEDEEAVNEALASLTRNDNLDGKFIALDPAAFGEETDAPFILIPAHIHTYVPWWGWVSIALGIVVLIAGVIITPMISLNRLTSRLGDSSEAEVQYAMRQLVMNGDERTVKKLYTMAASQNEGITTRLRAIDTMSLIERVPEVDRALLRLELASDTHDRIKEAAIAARKQREAARTRGRR